MPACPSPRLRDSRDASSPSTGAAMCRLVDTSTQAAARDGDTLGKRGATYYPPEAGGVDSPKVPVPGIVSRILSGAALTPYAGAGPQEGKRRRVDYTRLPVLWEGFFKLPAPASATGYATGSRTAGSVDVMLEARTPASSCARMPAGRVTV